jgi:hypothetical protein
MVKLKRLLPMASESRWLAGGIALLLMASLLVACQSGGYALECNQGVRRDACEQVGAFAFNTADFAASRVHVEARSCSRYFDSPPADTRCWSARLEKGGDFVVVAVTRTGNGELTEAHDLNPIFPSPDGD